MARLRVFVSSTYYDLKHIRSSLELMIEQLGHEAILFERGNVTFDPTKPLDESCYDEMASADIAVLIIGGRYGSEVSDTKAGEAELRDRFGEYDSITRKEHSTALANGLPVYTFIEKGVYAEYRTYLSNKGNDTVIYAHVDSPNVFRFIESIEDLGVGNVIHGFEKASDIEGWLKEQWSGSYRDLLRRSKEGFEVKTLAAEVARLTEAGKTLETYLEKVLRSVEPKAAEAIISEEAKRRLETMRLALEGTRAITYLESKTGVNRSAIFDALMEADSFEELQSKIETSAGFNNRVSLHLARSARNETTLAGELEHIRARLGYPRLKLLTKTGSDTEELPPEP